MFRSEVLRAVQFSHFDTSLTPRSTPNVLIIDAEIISSGHACGVVIFRGGWLAPSSENRTDGLDFGRLYASQFDSKTSGLSWLSLDGANQPPLKNTEISIPDGGPELIISGRGAIKCVPF